MRRFELKRPKRTRTRTGARIEKPITAKRSARFTRKPASWKTRRREPRTDTRAEPEDGPTRNARGANRRRKFSTMRHTIATRPRREARESHQLVGAWGARGGAGLYRLGGGRRGGT